MPRTQERYELELHCARCRRTTTHSVAIGDRSLSRVMCIACGRAVAVDTLQFMEQYVDSVMRRILAKPFEVTTEFTRSPRQFITSLPSRMFTKPFRVAAELRTTMDIVRLRRRPPPSSIAPTLPAAAGELPPVERRCQVLLSAPLMWAHTPDDLLVAARDLGYDGVEMWAYQLSWEGAEAAVLGYRAKTMGLALTLHALSWDLNLSSRLDAIRAASLDAVHRSVDQARELGARLVIVHPGRITVPFDDAEAYWPRLVASLQEIADHAAQGGIRVGVEHMEPRQGEYVITADQANRLVRDVDRANVGIVLDVAHIPGGRTNPHLPRDWSASSTSTSATPTNHGSISPSARADGALSGSSACSGPTKGRSRSRGFRSKPGPSLRGGTRHASRNSGTRPRGLAVSPAEASQPRL